MSKKVKGISVTFSEDELELLIDMCLKRITVLDKAAHILAPTDMIAENFIANRICDIKVIKEEILNKLF